ncbi:MAG: helicase-related protein [Candidatus Saccharimonas sp.]
MKVIPPQVTRERAIDTYHDHVPEPLVDLEAPIADRPEHKLGNVDLPIYQYGELIGDAVDENQVVIVTAETGAGKSTQVPQFLLEKGYDIVMTQPRRLATRNVAGRIGDEVLGAMGDEAYELVGWRTAEGGTTTCETKVQVVTDGLQLVRELSTQLERGEKHVLILDEVHEWNENMEVLVAWSKQEMKRNPNFKVVLMSATMEADKLAEFFADGGKKAPVIEVPGRTYPVEMSEGGDVVEETTKLAREGKNTLVFAPGKAEITTIINELNAKNIPGVTILPLYGQLSAEEQKQAFKKYPGTKIIVATNVAQTSITIEDIDAVVDTGLERRTEVKNGIEGLYLRPISQADCKQRAGRAGRTKVGEYVLAGLRGHPTTKLGDRPEYPTPEILRTRLDRMVLRLAGHGFDASELEFFHQPPKADIAAAKVTLERLGALDETGNITKIGCQMERMPIEAHYARMMVEARKYGAVVQTQLAGTIAALEAGGLIFHRKGELPLWQSLTEEPKEGKSDVLAQLDVFIATQTMSSFEKQQNSINSKNLQRAREVFRQLLRTEKLTAADLTEPSDEQRAQLTEAVIAGMVDHLYTRSYGGFENPRDGAREVSNRSMVRGADMVVGEPFDLQVQTKRGLRTLALIENVTAVPSLDVLKRVAPQLTTERQEGRQWGKDGVLYHTYRQYFNGQALNEVRTEPAEPSPEVHHEVLATLGYNPGEHLRNFKNVVNELRQLQQLTTEVLPVITDEDIRHMLEVVVPGDLVSYRDADMYVPELTLDDLVSSEMQAEIRAAAPARYGDLDVVYRAGRPEAQLPFTDPELILAMIVDDVTLPDGRTIYLRKDYWSDFTTLETLQYQIAEAEQARRAEEERQERLVAERARIAAEREAQQRAVDQAIYGQMRDEADAENRVYDIIAAFEVADERLKAIDARELPDKLRGLYQQYRQRLYDLWESPVLTWEEKRSRLSPIKGDITNLTKDIAKYQKESTRLLDDVSTQAALAALKRRFTRR